VTAHNILSLWDHFRNCENKKDGQIPREAFIQYFNIGKLLVVETKKLSVLVAGFEPGTGGIAISEV
jgi:hypothetical protein